MSTNAKLCDMCGFGAKHERCVICGQPFAKNMAYLCSSCSMGSEGDRCVKCRKPFAKWQAMLCPSCAMKYRNKCVKCGKTLI